MKLEDLLEKNFNSSKESFQIFKSIMQTIEEENNSKIVDHHFMKNVPTKYNEFLLLWLLENGHVVESLINVNISEKTNSVIGVGIGIKQRTILCPHD